MRKLFTVLLIAALAGFLCFSQVPSTQAQSRYGLRTSEPILTPGNIAIDADGVTMDYAVWVYGWKIYADTAASRATLKDCDTTAELMNHSTYPPNDEIGEPTQYEVTTVFYDKPMYFSEGVGVAVTIGTVFVIYGPEPA